MGHDTIAVIPARGGSKGIPRKNLQTVGGVPLVARAIIATQKARRLREVFVSSDDGEILAVASKFGATCILRPSSLSGDLASSEDALLHVLDYVEEQGGCVPKSIMMVQCTSPFITCNELDRLAASLDDGKYNSSLLVRSDHTFLWAREETESGARGVNHDFSRPRIRRQDLLPQFKETGAAYCMNTGPFIARRSRFCPPIALVESESAAIEIDSWDDLELANILAQGT